jgi:AcrR family transcriptional regulator
VVKESRLSLGAIYNYFQRKEEIIEAIADERHAREREARARESVADAMTQLRTAFSSPLKEPEWRRQLRMGVQLWAETLRNPRILKIIRRGFSEPHGLLTKLIAGAQGCGEISKALEQLSRRCWFRRKRGIASQSSDHNQSICGILP